MLGKRGRKFLGLFLVFFGVALLFQLYLQRTNPMIGLGDSLYVACGYSIPIALLATLLLMFVGKSGNGE